MSPIVHDLLTLYGPLALGWVFVVVLACYHVRVERAHRCETRKVHEQHVHELEKLRSELKDVTEQTVTCVVENTRVLTALSIRLEEQQRHARHGQ